MDPELIAADRAQNKAANYEYDYQEPYFEPANVEEDLLVQLSTKLAVTEIPREELKWVIDLEHLL